MEFFWPDNIILFAENWKKIVGGAIAEQSKVLHLLEKKINKNQKISRSPTAWAISKKLLPKTWRQDFAKDFKPPRPRTEIR